jgi:hypothetical protein
MTPVLCCISQSQAEEKAREEVEWAKKNSIDYIPAEIFYYLYEFRDPHNQDKVCLLQVRQNGPHIY